MKTLPTLMELPSPTLVGVADEQVIDMQAHGLRYDSSNRFKRPCPYCDRPMWIGERIEATSVKLGIDIICTMCFKEVQANAGRDFMDNIDIHDLGG